MSTQNEPSSVLQKAYRHPAKAMNPPRIRYQLVTMKFERFSRNFVAQGRMSSLPWKTAANFGSTNVSRKTVTHTASPPMIAG